MKRLVLGVIWSVAATLPFGAIAGDKLSTSELREMQAQVEAMYPPAKTTADGTDLVSPGAVIVLKKDDLLMNKVEMHIPTPNVYKAGKISPSGLFGALSSLNTHLTADQPHATRAFVVGEKFWISRVEAMQDGVTLAVISDPIKDQRYHATLKVPYPKDSNPPSVDVVLNVLSEVITSEGGGAPTQAAPATRAAPAPPAPTKTIALGQTRDQVVAMFGVPTKVVQLGSKEIDYFPDMKVTFVQNKVANVE